MSFTVTITGVSAPVEVYAGLAFVDDYLGSSNTKGAKQYRALVASGDTDTRARLLVDATRYVDEQGWDGVALLAGTTLQFPRSGLADDATTQLGLVAKAVAELVALLQQNSELAQDPDAGSNVKVLGAGTGRIEFFRPTSAQDGNATVMPPVIERLIGHYAAAASASVSGAVAGIATGTETCGFFGPCKDTKRWSPF